MNIVHSCPSCIMPCACDLDEGYCIHCSPASDMSLEIANRAADLAESLAWEDTWE